MKNGLLSDKKIFIVVGVDIAVLI